MRKEWSEELMANIKPKTQSPPKRVSDIWYSKVTARAIATQMQQRANIQIWADLTECASVES